MVTNLDVLKQIEKRLIGLAPEDLNWVIDRTRREIDEKKLDDRHPAKAD